MGKQARLKRNVRRWLEHQQQQRNQPNRPLFRTRGAAEDQPKSSPWKERELSESDEALEAKRELLRKFDNYSECRDIVGRIAEYGKEWAGMPIPVTGEKLIIADGYPFKKQYETLGFAPKESELIYIEREDETHTTFWSDRHHSYIVVFRNKEGRVVHWGQVPPINRLNLALTTMGCSVAWSIESEARALRTLAELVTYVAFKYYLLTGTFLESSKRSGIFYVFRKLRPTVAMTGATGDMRILCSLCLHPIGYYQDSHAGALCPTDDVISHLMLMRADEHYFWRKANQHHPIHPEAAI